MSIATSKNGSGSPITRVRRAFDAGDKIPPCHYLTLSRLPFLIFAA